jgi:DNA-binding transcriptional MerR regulator
MDDKTLSIGDVIAVLSPEFPDITASSLRFLEKEGLLHPKRTPGGHRLYSDRDIAGIRLIKRLQLQRHYPLKTIRHMIGKLERAKDVEAEMAFLESLYAPLSYDPK